MRRSGLRVHPVIPLPAAGIGSQQKDAGTACCALVIAAMANRRCGALAGCGHVSRAVMPGVAGGGSSAGRTCWRRCGGSRVAGAVRAGPEYFDGVGDVGESVLVLQSLFHVECLDDTGGVADAAMTAVTVSSCGGKCQRA